MISGQRRRRPAPAASASRPPRPRRSRAASRRGWSGRRRRRRVRPGLHEDRIAVVQGEPGRRADRSAVHRCLADALMGEERRQVLRVRAQVGEVHDRRLPIARGRAHMTRLLDVAHRCRASGRFVRSAVGSLWISGVSSTGQNRHLPILYGSPGRLAGMDNRAACRSAAPADVLAAIPYLLGFAPADSVVVLGLRSEEDHLPGPGRPAGPADDRRRSRHDHLRRSSPGSGSPCADRRLRRRRPAVTPAVSRRCASSCGGGGSTCRRRCV